MNLLQEDYKRYTNKKQMPKWAIYYRKCQGNKGLLRLFYRFLFKKSKEKYCIELPYSVQIGGGIYWGHPFAIAINPHVIIGKNCNIHKGVTIGQENRGSRKGTPVIGDEVWIGVNATIVGNIKIGNNVLIAPNSYVNCDIPPNSIVLGNPCIIKPNEHATTDYINRKI